MSFVVPSMMIDGYSEKAETVNAIDGDNAWNKPVNGVMADEAGIVIGGADFWPSLSEGVNTRVKPSYRTVPESSMFLTTQVSSSKNNVGDSGIRTNSSHNGTRSGSNRQPKNNATRFSSHHHQHRQSSQVSDSSSSNGFHNVISQLDASTNNGPRPQLRSGGNQSQHRDSNRRGNGGPSHGDGSHGGLRNVDRDANAQPQGFKGRTGPGQPPVFPGPFPIPIPSTALHVAPYPPPPPPLPPIPFMPPGMHQFSGRPMFYGPPVGQFMMRPHLPYLPPGPTSIIPELRKQIEYYFSDENLVRDVHLRSNMDEHGWVVVTTIAKFKKVNEIMAKVKKIPEEKEIDPIAFILNAMHNSQNVEVQGNKLRKRVDWKKYILRNSGESSSPSAESHATKELVERFENTVTVEKPVNCDFKPAAEEIHG